MPCAAFFVFHLEQLSINPHALLRPLVDRTKPELQRSTDPALAAFFCLKLAR